MTLQSTTPTNTQRAGANRRNLLAIVGVTAVAVGLAVNYNVPWTKSTPVPVEAQPVAATATPEQPTDTALRVQIARLALPEQTMADDGIECLFVDDTGKEFCVRFVAKVKDRRAAGYYD